MNITRQKLQRQQLPPHTRTHTHIVKFVKRQLIKMQYIITIAFLVILFVVSNGFMVPAIMTKRSKMSMFLNFGGKATSTESYKVNQGTANKGTYIPDGITKEQYEAKLKAEADAKAAKAKKFPKGKNVETLTDWIEKCEAKGLYGKDMHLKGHRLAKAKYDSMYTNQSPI